MSKEEQRKEWELRVTEFKASGQSQAAWCREKKINLKNFNYWYRKFKNNSEQQKKSTSWIPLEAGVSVKKRQESKMNIRIGHAFIEVTPDFDPELFSNVAEVLSKLC